MSRNLKRFLSALVAVIMVIGIIPVASMATPLTAETVETRRLGYLDTAWAALEAVESEMLALGATPSEVTMAVYKAAVNNNLVDKDSFTDAASMKFSFTVDGMHCVYDYTCRNTTYTSSLSQETINDIMDVATKPATTPTKNSAGSMNVLLVGPYYDSDTSFTDQYKTESTSIGTATGGTVTQLINANATGPAIAAAYTDKGIVIYDSHGTQSGTSSYLCLTTNTGITTTDYNNGWAVSSGSAAYIDGRYIQNHVSGTLSNCIVWMAICEGMKSSGNGTTGTALLAAGAGCVYGYSQSVSFTGDYEYEEYFWNMMKNGSTVSEAFTSMTASLGNWDPAYSSSSGAAWPIVMSATDAFPSTPDSHQTVTCDWSIWGQDPVAVESIAITPSDASIAQGRTTALAATITPSTANGYTKAWTSGNTAVATVSSTGEVTGVSAGTATITLTVTDENSKAVYTASATVTVTDAPKYEAVNTIVVGDEYLIGIVVGSNVYLLMNYNPSPITSSNNYYYSSSSNYYGYVALATLDTNGRVIGCSGWCSDLQYCLWNFSTTTGGLITSQYNSSYHLAIYNSTTYTDLHPSTSTSYASWIWNASTNRLTHVYSSSTKYVSYIATVGSYSNFCYAPTSATSANSNVQLYGLAAETPTTNYTVTFVDYDGTVLSTQSVAEGGSATAPANPTRTGYTFAGWNGSYTNITGDVTVTATYTINSYALTINYVYADGTTASAAYTSNVNYGASYSVTSPTITGYTADQLTVAGTMGTAAVTVTVTYTANPTQSVAVTYTGATTTLSAPSVGDTFYWTISLSENSQLYAGHWLIDHNESFFTPTAVSTTWEGSVTALINESITGGTQTSDLPNFVYNVNYEGQTGQNPYGEAGNFYTVIGMYLTSFNYNGLNIGGDFARITYTVAAVPTAADMQSDANGTYIEVPITVLESNVGDTTAQYGYVPSYPVTVVNGKIYVVESVEHTLTINYTYVDGTVAAAAYTAVINAGDAYSVTSPVVANFHADQTVVAGTMGGADVTVNVVYTHDDIGATYTGEVVTLTNAAVGDTFTWMISVSDASGMYSGHWLIDHNEAFLTPTDVNVAWSGGITYLINQLDEDGTQYSDKPAFVSNTLYEGNTGSFPHGEAGNYYTAIGMYLTTYSHGGVQMGGNFARITYTVAAVPTAADLTTDADGTYMPIPIVVIESTFYDPTSQYDYVVHNPINVVNGKIYFTDSVDRTLTINYVYADGTTASATHSETLQTGDAYSVTSPVITGYTADTLVVAGTMGDNNVSVTVTYTPNQYNLTINYVYANGTTAAATHTSTVAYNTAYSVTSPVIEGYTADTLVVAGTMGASDVTVTVTYTAGTHSLIINYTYVDGTEAAATYTTAVATGDAYSVTSPAIANFHADQTVVAGTMGTADTTITVIYTHNDIAVTYTGESVVLTGAAVGDTFTWMISVSDASGMYSGHWLIDHNEAFLTPTGVNVTWSGGITYLINQLDEDGTQYSDKPAFVSNTLYEGNSGSFPQGEAGNYYTAIGMYLTTYSHAGVQMGGNFARISYTVAAVPTAADLTTDASGSYLPLPIIVVESTFYDPTSQYDYVVHNPINVIDGKVYFAEEASHTLTIAYQYADGTTAATTYTGVFTEGAAYTVDSPVLPGYTADTVTVAGVMGSSDVTVTVIYTADEHTLTINYVYADGTSAAEGYVGTVAYNAAYSVTSPVIAGYTADTATVAGVMGSSDVTVTVTYTVNEYTLTINYVYADGTSAAEGYVGTVAYNAAYSVTSPVIADYTADTLVVEGTMPADNVTITVTYTANPSSDFVWGDANCDGHCDFQDIALIYSAINGVGGTTISAQGLINADVGGTLPSNYDPSIPDGQITFLDLTTIYSTILS